MLLTVRENLVIWENEQVVEADHLEYLIEEIQSEFLFIEMRLFTGVPDDVKWVQEYQELKLVTSESWQNQDNCNEKVPLNQEERVVILTSSASLKILSFI